MSTSLYKCWNSAMPTTAAIVKVATGTSIKTMLQIATPSTNQLKVVSWGFSLDTAPATTGVGVVELLETDVAATVTAHVAAGVQPQTAGGNASVVTLGTSATGYTATVEGSITTTRTFDSQEVSGVSNGMANINYSYQFMPDERPIVAVSKFLRVRATFSASANMLCWVTWAE